MKKRLHLNEALQKASTQKLEAEVSKCETQAASRAGKKVIAGHFDKEVVKISGRVTVNFSIKK